MRYRVDLPDGRSEILRRSTAKFAFAVVALDSEGWGVLGLFIQEHVAQKVAARDADLFKQTRVLPAINLDNHGDNR